MTTEQKRGIPEYSSKQRGLPSPRKKNVIVHPKESLETVKQLREARHESDTIMDAVVKWRRFLRNPVLQGGWANTKLTLSTLPAHPTHPLEVRTLLLWHTKYP